MNLLLDIACLSPSRCFDCKWFRVSSTCRPLGCSLQICSNIMRYDWIMKLSPNDVSKMTTAPAAVWMYLEDRTSNQKSNNICCSSITWYINNSRFVIVVCSKWLGFLFSVLKGHIAPQSDRLTFNVLTWNSHLMNICIGRMDLSEACFIMVQNLWPGLQNQSRTRDKNGKDRIQPSPWVALE